MSQSVTIAASGTTSGAINLGGRSIVKIEAPAMTGTLLTVLEKDTAGNYVSVYDDAGTALSFVVGAAARVIHVSPSKSIEMGSIELVSNGTEASDRTIYVFSEPYTP